MEYHGWQQCQRKNTAAGVGTLALLPPSWDNISAIYQEVVKFVSNFPYQKRLVLYFAYRGTTVKLDLGDVRAAGAVCILGLGVGLGTLFIYRLYRQYIRPFLDLWGNADEEKNSSGDCGLFVNSSDSAVDGAMGNNSSGSRAPPVYYSPEYGVALGGKSVPAQRQAQSTVDSVRLRRLGTRSKPVRKHSANRDVAGGHGANLSPLYNEASIRDSFYSTAESGFETLPECNEDDENEEGEELSQSLKENFSVSSLNERNDRYFGSSSGDHANSTGDFRTVVSEVTTQKEGCENDPSLSLLHAGHAPFSPVKSLKSSPQHKVPDSHLLSVKRSHGYPNSDDLDYDPSLEASESICSFNSSCEEWSWADEERDCMSPLPHTHSAMSDRQFRQSLMQRIREWSTFAEEYGKSRSPTPDCASPPCYIRRSRSLDRHLGEPAFAPEVDVSSSEPIKVEDTTAKNLECLETELHDIQDEFESITSKLHELIERGNKDAPPPPQQQAKTSPSHRLHHSSHHHHHQHHHSRPPQANSALQRSRTKWERLPPLTHSDSNCSSRASSVEFSWDCGEVGGTGDGREEGLETGGRVEQAAVGESGNKTQPVTEGQTSTGDPPSEQVVSVGEAVSMEDYAEKEWKGQTEKAETIRKGYQAVSDVFHCERLRRVRGDNYCALRSTLFQVLVDGHRVTRRWPGLISIVDRLHALQAEPASGLQHWTFGGRLPWGGEDEKFSLICKCVLSLYATIEEISALPTREEREGRTLGLLNSSEDFDIQLMEGMKLMMLFRVADLQREMAEELEVPTFAWLLFARDTSETVVDFVKNHLNCVGDSAGVDQVEMCLLGHCLGVKLRVARLDHFGQEDFDVCFPDEAPDDWPSISLMAEDDRHYNVPVP